MHEPQVPLLPEYPRLVAGLVEQTRFVHNFPDVLAKSEKDRYLFCILELLVSVFDNEKRFADTGKLTRDAGGDHFGEESAVHCPKPAGLQRKPETNFRGMRLAHQRTRSTRTPLKNWTPDHSKTSLPKSAKSWRKRSPQKNPAAPARLLVAQATQQSTGTIGRRVPSLTLKQSLRRRCQQRQ